MYTGRVNTGITGVGGTIVGGATTGGGVRLLTSMVGGVMTGTLT